MATPRQSASAGGLNEVRGWCILNHWWIDRTPSALVGSWSRGGAPDQRPQPKAEMQNHFGAQALHYTLNFSLHDGVKTPKPRLTTVSALWSEQVGGWDVGT